MTNILIGVTILRFLTNSGATTICSDGKGGVMREQRYVVSAEVVVNREPVDGEVSPPSFAVVPWDVYTRIWTLSAPPVPPPLPFRTKPMRTMASSPGLILEPASIVDPDCQCPFFRVSFVGHTNRIYSFERSRDLRSWELRPPEIDGEEGVSAFYDVFDTGAMYRIASREGVLP